MFYLLQLMGKGNLVSSKTMMETVPFTSYSFRIDVDMALAQTLAPSMRIIVCTRMSDDELICDSASFNVEGTRVNNVRFLSHFPQQHHGHG